MGDRSDLESEVSRYPYADATNTKSDAKPEDIDEYNRIAAAASQDITYFYTNSDDADRFRDLAESIFQ